MPQLPVQPSNHPPTPKQHDQADHSRRRVREMSGYSEPFQGPAGQHLFMQKWYELLTSTRQTPRLLRGNKYQPRRLLFCICLHLQQSIKDRDIFIEIKTASQPTSNKPHRRTNTKRVYPSLQPHLENGTSYTLSDSVSVGTNAIPAIFC
jgi:hypothetical protein